MLEHAFYQGLNLCQALYLHALLRVPRHHTRARLALLGLVTSPWLVRSRFPINSFSKNWKLKEKREREERKERGGRARGRGGEKEVGEEEEREKEREKEEREMFDGLLRVLYRIKKWQYGEDFGRPYPRYHIHHATTTSPRHHATTPPRHHATTPTRHHATTPPRHHTTATFQRHNHDPYCMFHNIFTLPPGDKLRVCFSGERSVCA